MEYIDTETGDSSALDEGLGDEVRSAVVTEAHSELTAKRIAMLEVSEIPDVNVATISEDLAHIYQTIKRHSSPLDDAQQDQLSWLADATHATHLLFYRCQLYAGPDGYWDPMSGAIGSASSRVVLEFHLYDISHESVVWTQRAQTYASPHDAPSHVPTMVSLALETLDID